MSTQRNERRQYDLEPELAPAVEKTWAEKLILELRLLGVDGGRIGDALSEANSHCEESGQTAQEAFGDPIEYARCLDLPAEENQVQKIVRVILPVLVQLAGMNVFLAGLTATKSGEPVNITLGNAVVVVLLLGAFALLVLRAEKVLRTLLKRPVLAVVGMVGFFALHVAALLVFQAHSLAEVPAPPALAIGFALLAWGVVWQLVITREGRIGAEDPVTSPLSHPEALVKPREDKRERLLAFVLSWMIPLYTVVVVLFIASTG